MKPSRKNVSCTRALVALAVVIKLGLGTPGETEAATLTVNTTSTEVIDDGLCALPEAIIAANQDAPLFVTPGECPAGDGADVIHLGLQQTYVLLAGSYAVTSGANGLPAISSELTIDGHGSLIQRDPGASKFRVLEVSETGILHLTSLAIADGAGVDVLYGSGLGAPGGCILNYGELHLESTSLQNCRAGDSGGFGGAIFTSYLLTMNNSSITAAAAGDGGVTLGGGFGGAIFNSGGTVVISDSSLTGNQAGSSAISYGGSAGAIFSENGLVSLANSVLSANVAGGGALGEYGGFGGGIFASNSTVQMSQTTVSLNTAGDGGIGGYGGGVATTGGTLVANGCTFELNHAGDAVPTSNPGSGGWGGAIYSSGVVDLNACSLLHNHAGAGGDASGGNANGGYGGAGGGIYAYLGATLFGCVVDGNRGGDGGYASPAGYGGPGGAGAVVNEAGFLHIQDTTISNNEAGTGGGAPSDGNAARGGNGGGIYTGGSVRLVRSALVGNRAGKGGSGVAPGNGGDGGGLFTLSNDAIIGNVTISGNSAGDGGDAQALGIAGGVGGNGGGVFNENHLVLAHVTISGNSAGEAGAATVDVVGDGQTGGLHAASGIVVLANAILADSESGFDCYAPNADVLGGMDSIIEDGGCGLGLAVDPRLVPLAFNGGSTLTHALCTGPGTPSATCADASPALYAGSVPDCLSSAVDSLDQRGATRDGGVDCDSGAFESGPVAAVAAASRGARPGGVACVPVSLTGGTLSSTSNLLTYGDNVISGVVQAALNPALGVGTTANKELAHARAGNGAEIVSVFGTPDEQIPKGLLYTAVLAVDAATPVGTYTVGAAGGAALTVTTCGGDCDGNGMVSLSEAQRCVNMLLGAPTCDLNTGQGCPVADADHDGELSVGELQQCVNHFVSGC